jgi:hypothetical protein
VGPIGDGDENLAISPSDIQQEWATYNSTMFAHSSIARSGLSVNSQWSVHVWTLSIPAQLPFRAWHSVVRRPLQTCAFLFCFLIISSP